MQERDRDFLIWLHEKLENVHGDDRLESHMHRLRTLIAATPPERETKGSIASNSLEDLLEKLERGPMSRMTVVKRGIPESEKLVCWTCSHCNSKIEAPQSAGKPGFSPRNEAYIEFACPVCGKTSFVDR